MLKIRKSYRLLLSTLLFVGVLLLQFHYHDHDDDVGTEHCPICLVKEVFDLSDMPQVPFAFAFVAFIFIAFVAIQSALPLTQTKNNRTRAPPLFS